MTSSTYGTAELQGDASPSPPKPYMSRVAKIALALIACSAAAVIAHPGTRSTTTNLVLDSYGMISNLYDDSGNRAGGGAAPVKSTSPKDQVQDLQVRVAAIEKYLLATGSIEKYLKATGGSGGSGTSRGKVMMPVVLGMMARGHGARRRLRGA